MITWTEAWVRTACVSAADQPKTSALQEKEAEDVLEDVFHTGKRACSAFAWAGGCRLDWIWAG